ncbi:GPI anchored serine-threonine rich family protein [Aspergillus thermomutatus]|uniref:Yeast cell wall synthesis Kre9/Knh1-like N-terminal domain-containing protein n=1 Tax=Aspergillus thermomutatus TaxID=41047 RepID=A0A397HKX6_ASPTH|nr:uncharacterized protein CDV56_109030 [Aspergillus thermomutatus]RHZ63627.1 hypothetical protein CDV56_109030 [Aspergillus thermomutatus]
MRLIASIVSCLAALAMASTQADYSQSPSGNAIVKPGLNELVPAGKPYTIEWDPTTKGPVSLVLLRGPSTNVVPIETLADSIPNSGSFSWTPSTSLEPDTTHYGIMLVVESTGQYQYSTQFGISNPDYTGSTSNSSSTAAGSSTATAATATKSSSVTETSSTQSTTGTTTATSASASADSSTTATASETPSTTLVTKSSTSDAPTSTVVVTVPDSTGAASSAVASGSASHSSTPSPSATLSSGGDRKAISLGAVVVGAFAVMAF